MILLALACLAPTPTASADRPWSLDDALVTIQVFNDPDTLAAASQSDHILHSQTFQTAEVHWSPEDPTHCLVEIGMRVEDLVVDAPEMRRRAGYEPLTEAERQIVRQEMLGPRQLDAEAHPTLAFSAHRCFERDGRMVVDGALTLHGVTRPVLVPTNVRFDEGFQARGATRIRATDFGFEPWSAMGGAVGYQDTMKLTVELAGR